MTSSQEKENRDKHTKVDDAFVYSGGEATSVCYKGLKRISLVVIAVVVVTPIADDFISEKRQ